MKIVLNKSSKPYTEAEEEIVEALNECIPTLVTLRETIKQKVMESSETYNDAIELLGNLEFKSIKIDSSETASRDENVWVLRMILKALNNTSNELEEEATNQKIIRS